MSTQAPIQNGGSPKSNVIHVNGAPVFLSGVCVCFCPAFLRPCFARGEHFVGLRPKTEPIRTKSEVVHLDTLDSEDWPSIRLDRAASILPITFAESLLHLWFPGQLLGPPAESHSITLALVFRMRCVFLGRFVQGSSRGSSAEARRKLMTNKRHVFGSHACIII